MRPVIKPVLILLALSLLIVPTAAKDVVFLVDTSGSMRDTDSIRGELVDRDLDQLDPKRDRTALITFDYDTQIVAPLTTDFDEIRVDDLDAQGGTDTYGALNTAVGLLGENNEDAEKEIVLITDGFGSYTYTGESPVQLVRERDYPVHVVALYPDDDSANPLRIIARETGGTYKAIGSSPETNGPRRDGMDELPDELPEYPSVAVPILAVLGVLFAIHSLGRS